MLQWDLSNTPLAQGDTPKKVPTEGELLALMVGLLMLEDVTYDALRHHVLVLDEENLGRLLEVFEYRLPELAREFGDSERLRKRLGELIGIRMTRTCETSSRRKAPIKGEPRLYQTRSTPSIGLAPSLSTQYSWEDYSACRYAPFGVSIALVGFRAPFALVVPCGGVSKRLPPGLRRTVLAAGNGRQSKNCVKENVKAPCAELETAIS